MTIMQHDTSNDSKTAGEHASPKMTMTQEVLTLLVNAKSVAQRPQIRGLKARATAYLPLAKLTRMALKADRRDLPTSIGVGPLCGRPPVLVAWASRFAQWSYWTMTQPNMSKSTKCGEKTQMIK
jgi:hypothetical protein